MQKRLKTPEKLREGSQKKKKTGRVQNKKRREKSYASGDNGAGVDVAESGLWDTHEWIWNETFATWVRWDITYGTWVLWEEKRPRKKDLTNKMEKNWLLGMRRNWQTEKKDKMVAKITITRKEMDQV